MENEYLKLNKNKSLSNQYLKFDKNKSLGYNVIKKRMDIVCCAMKES